MTLVDVQEVTVRFGGIVALDWLTFGIDAGHICGLIGPNGAGKTTMFNVVSRIYEPTSGSVTYDGKDLLAVPAHGIAALGIARTFQNLALFPSMSLLENVMVGAHSQGEVGIARAISRIGARARTGGRGISPATSSSSSARPADVPPRRRPTVRHAQALEIARALAARPRFLLMDEPASGLTHGEVDGSARRSCRSATSSTSRCCSSSTTCRW